MLPMVKSVTPVTKMSAPPLWNAWGMRTAVSHFQVQLQVSNYLPVFIDALKPKPHTLTFIFILSAPSGVSTTMKGCITKNMCGQKANMLQNPDAQFNCCEGDLCNSATSISAGLLFLLASLISVFMIS